jgi:hypothetical protein
MNQSNTILICSLLDILHENKNAVVYDEIPAPCHNIIYEATQLKRQKQYDAAIAKYFEAIKLGYFTTEIGRVMCKTLCAMNEYQIAFLLLFSCANVKWRDTIRINPMYGAAGQDLLQKMGRELPTACANDFYLLRDAIHQGAKGDLKPLFERTKEVSGQKNYQNVKTNNQILLECKAISDAWHFDENLR